MNATRISVALAIVLAFGSALGADKPRAKRADLGQAEFREHCVVCHGAEGTGNGSYVELLKKAPPDLTTLSRRNGGVFPLDRVYAVIDGRDMVKAHGDRDMPIWGTRYGAEGGKAAEYYGDMAYDMEMYARTRILSLVDYINRLQKK
jgi:mono/diheme cytochrome c family protein